MPSTEAISPALAAAREAESLVSAALREGRHFLLEAGAGAGKTYSLVEALKQLLTTERRQLQRNNQQIACITYTNAAADIITKRITTDVPTYRIRFREVIFLESSLLRLMPAEDELLS